VNEHSGSLGKAFKIEHSVLEFLGYSDLSLEIVHDSSHLVLGLIDLGAGHTESKKSLPPFAFHCFELLFKLGDSNLLFSNVSLELSLHGLKLVLNIVLSSGTVFLKLDKDLYDFFAFEHGFVKLT
jgi:hypothetical protein